MGTMCASAAPGSYGRLNGVGTAPLRCPSLRPLRMFFANFAIKGFKAFEREVRKGKAAKVAKKII
jgi:hypothetical protein